jgi:hypothetical protein
LRGLAGSFEGYSDLARYFFHIRNALCVVPDDEGVEMPNIFAAQAEDYLSACDLAWAAIKSRSGRDADAVEIADKDGNLLGWINVPSTLH